MSRNSPDRQLAALEAAVAHHQEVLAEGQSLPRKGKPPRPPRLWAPMERMIGITTAVTTICAVAVGVMVTMHFPADDSDLRYALENQRNVEKWIAELKKELPSTRRKLAGYKQLEPDPPRPGEPKIPVTRVEEALKQIMNRATRDPLPRSLLAWLNVGLAGCKVRNKQVALDAARQLGLYVPLNSRGPSPGVSAQTMLVLYCREDGVELGAEVIGSTPKRRGSAAGD